jgi:putative effector of murein hydrolase
MSGPLTHLWSSFAGGYLVWLVLTLGAYLAGRRLQSASGGSPVANPVLIAVLIVIIVLAATGTPYRTYFAGAQFIHFLLGPATIALAIPLAGNFSLIRANLTTIVAALLAGSVTSIVSGITIVHIFAGSHAIGLSMAPKAATTPIAMAVSQQVGGIPGLTASLAILGGIVAAVAGQRLLNGFAISDSRTLGLTAGVAGSGIAAAHVAAQSEVAAAFAAIGIGMNGLFTALLVPLFVALWH